MKFVSRSAVIVATLLTAATHAATVTTTFPVTATVEASCLVSASALNFGTYAQGMGDVDQTSTISVRCSQGVSFSVGLNGGSAGGTPTNRHMDGPSSGELQYALYRDSGRTNNWGNTVGVDTASGTGQGFQVGDIVELTVYGRISDNVANQSQPTGSYSDTITVTVTY